MSFIPLKKNIKKITDTTSEINACNVKKNMYTNDSDILFEDGKFPPQY